MIPSLLKQVLLQLVPAHEPVLLKGAPGVGKTDIVKWVAEQLGYDLIISHPVVSDPSDSKGLAWPAKDGKSAVFIPIGQVAQLLSATRPTIWFLDDLGQAVPAVQAAYMQWLLAREVNGHKLPDCVSILSATNRRQDKSGVTAILEAVKGRFMTMYQVDPDINDWTQWAFAHSMPHMLIAFLRFRKDLLLDFKPTADIDNSPTPRNWASVGRAVNLKLPDAAHLETFGGAVGMPAATEFTGFLRVASKMPNPDAVLLNPHSGDVPTDPSVMWALATSLVGLVTPANFNRFLQYVERVVKGNSAEYATYMAKASVDVHPELTATPEFTQFITSELSKKLGLR